MPDDPRAPGSAPPCAGSRMTTAKVFCGGAGGSDAGCAGRREAFAAWNRSRSLWRGLGRRCRSLRRLRLRRKCLGGRNHPHENQANQFAGHSPEDTRIIPDRERGSAEYFPRCCSLEATSLIVFVWRGFTGRGRKAPRFLSFRAKRGNSLSFHGVRSRIDSSLRSE